MTTGLVVTMRSVRTEMSLMYANFGTAIGAGVISREKNVNKGEPVVRRSKKNHSQLD